jgi:hypothetical protein
MKRSIVILAALLTIACSLVSLKAIANDGDWIEGNIAQWWWKYVRVGDGSVKPAGVRIEEVRSDRLGYRAYTVTYVITNTAKTVYKGGESYRIELEIAEPDPHPWKPSLIARGLTPGLNAGASARIMAKAYTPEKGSFNSLVGLTIE